MRPDAFARFGAGGRLLTLHRVTDRHVEAVESGRRLALLLRPLALRFAIDWQERAAAEWSR
jgi:hypothetical protein